MHASSADARWFARPSSLTTMPSRQRDRKQLMRDAVLASESALSDGSKYALLDNDCWTLSELAGKYEGCRYWSKRTLAQRSDLRHEHSLPR
jgi:hypothetical protein